MEKSKIPYTYTKSPTGPAKCWANGLSLKIIVWNENLSTDSVAFTSDGKNEIINVIIHKTSMKTKKKLSHLVSTPTQVVIEQAITNMGIDNFRGEDYLFRVKGLDEYFDSERMLIEYKYIQECIKLDEDVCLVLVHKSSLAKGNWTRPVC